MEFLFSLINNERNARGCRGKKQEKKRKAREQEGFGLKSFLKLRSLFLYSAYITKRRGGLYIHASRLMSQPVLCKGDDSHPSCMTCWKP
jgi:hypothetical protein